MSIKIKRSTYKVDKNAKEKAAETYFIAHQYDDHKLQAYSFMTEWKGK